MIPIDEVVIFDVVTHVAATAAVSDADSAPSFDVFEEDTDTPILAAQTMTKRTSKTGNYRGSVTCSAANGFEAGKWYSVVVSATVSSVSAKCVAKHFRIAPAETAAGVPKADTAYWLGTAVTLSTGVPDVNVKTITAAIIAAGSFAANALDAVWSTATRTLTAASDTSGVTTLLTRLSATRAGYLDNLSAGAAALESSVQALITTVGGLVAATATAIWAAGTRLLTAGTNIVLAKGVGVTGFNDLSAAQVNAEADTALADYDGPTHAELTSELATADDATLAAIAALPASPSAATIASQVRTELATELARVDAAVTTRATPADVPTAVQNADAYLKRDMSLVTGEAARSPLNALRFNRNRFTIIAGVLTVYREDDTTVAWTAVLTQTAGNPVSASDPA